MKWTLKFLFIIFCLATLASVLTLAFLRQPHTTTVMEGYHVATQLGCFGCHGPDGMGGVPNPGSKEGWIPPLTYNATLKYYVQQENEIKEWILYGLPRRAWKNRDQSPKSSDLQTAEEVSQGGLIQMPAYEGMLSEKQLQNLIDYVKNLMTFEKPDTPEAEKGRRLASQLGCFHCHGPNGQGGGSNPGSFKGYIPAWYGKDFEEIVESDQELRGWILDGKIERFENNPIAKYFTSHQTIKMPPYKDRLKEGDLEAIVAYIRWLTDRKPAPVEPWTEPRKEEPVLSRVERGKWLYRQSGCVACHGIEGRGGVFNPNYIAGSVPSLNDLADKMEIFEKKHADMVISVLDKGMPLEDLEKFPPFLNFPAVLARYHEMWDVILKGSRSQSKDPNRARPPMQMPPWSERLHPDPAPGSETDISAIIAYLLTLQTWGEGKG